jgi:hypothetical protein
VFHHTSKDERVAKHDFGPPAFPEISLLARTTLFLRQIDRRASRQSGEHDE